MSSQSVLNEFPYNLDDFRFRKVKKISQLLGLALLMLFILYILFKNIAPYGMHVEYVSEPEKQNISDLGPKKRIERTNYKHNMVTNIKDDLVYFTTRMPLQFDKAVVDVTYKNNSLDQSISLGFQDQEQWHYNIKPLDAPFLNSINWKHIGKNPTLYQREPQYNSIDDFLKSPPKDKLIGTYEYDNYLGDISSTQLSNYTPQKQETIIDTPLRGKHIMYAYLRNEPFHLTVQKQDLNSYEDPDPMIIKIYKDKDLVYLATIEDDGVVDASKKITSPQTVSINNPGPGFPESGVYKIVFDANGDTIIKRITTNLHKIVFQGPIYPVANSEVYPGVIASTSATTLYTNALSISAITYHQGGVQDISVGNQVFQLTQNNLKNEVVFTPDQDFVKITIPKNDVVLNAIQGYFAFETNQFFLPSPREIMPITKVQDLSLVDFVLTDYLPPKNEGEWKTAELTYDLKTAYVVNDKLSWIIQAPGLKDNNRTITIKNIDIQFNKNPWLRTTNLDFLIIPLLFGFAIFFPGFIISFIFYKRKTINFIKRLWLSFGISIIVVPIVILFAYVIGFPITIITVYLFALLIIVTSAIIITLQSWRDL